MAGAMHPRMRDELRWAYALSHECYALLRRAMRADGFKMHPAKREELSYAYALSHECDALLPG